MDERVLLSFCMKDVSFYYTVCSKLVPNDFLYEQHSMIMLIFQSLAAQGIERFDVNLIISEAQSNGVIENIGGLKYIQTISGMDHISEDNFEIYLTSVVEATAKYKLYCILQNNMSDISENAKSGLTSSDLISKSEANLMELSMTSLNIDEPKNLADGLSEEIEKRKELQIVLSGLPTGYDIVDKQIDGMIDGTLLIIASRQKMGKSALLTNIALHVAYKEMKPVLYVDTELTFEEWRNRAVAIMSGVKERDVKHGGYDEKTYNNLITAMKIIKNGSNLFHEYMPGYSVDKLVTLYKKYKQKENIGLMIFDYLKEPDSSSVDRQRKEYQILGDVTTKLKDLSGRLNIPVLTAVQLNRDNDIADSDRIARYGDIICHWAARKQEEQEEGGINSGTHKLIIRNTRRGGTTNEHGIGFNFFKDYLIINEVGSDKQYFTNFDKVVNYESAGKFGNFRDDELL
jgi:replicative DNA helicase